MAGDDKPKPPKTKFRLISPKTANFRGFANMGNRVSGQKRFTRIKGELARRANEAGALLAEPVGDDVVVVVDR